MPPIPLLETVYSRRISFIGTRGIAAMKGYTGVGVTVIDRLAD